MKNVHLFPTDKPSRLIVHSTLLNEFRLLDKPYDDWLHKRHIYITSDEEPKYLNHYFDFENGKVKKCETGYYKKGDKKIVLTTDQDLINDDVQAIDDAFLEWFVKNPSCDSVEVTRNFADEGIKGITYYGKYFITIPTEEPKQETERGLIIKKSDGSLIATESNKKQTAVEWLWNKIDTTLPYQNARLAREFKDLLPQAKAMEKEQIINAHNSGENILPPNENGEQYYNQTYLNPEA